MENILPAQAVRDQFSSIKETKCKILLIEFKDFLVLCQHWYIFFFTQLKIDENTIVTGSEDGFVRGLSVYPNKILRVLGQHE